ncbi:MAG: hypothetical protein JSW58_05565 [Candidatus Latescibacterota bacterium]|nr:MAG: hypothetical protein JSW58_05565 [Candidatus Latescibacterota bacterium]
MVAEILSEGVLFDTATNEGIWQKDVYSMQSAGMRNQTAAIEGAIRQNLRSPLAELAKLDL